MAHYWYFYFILNALKIAVYTQSEIDGRNIMSDLEFCTKNTLKTLKFHLKAKFSVRCVIYVINHFPCERTSHIFYNYFLLVIKQQYTTIQQQYNNLLKIYLYTFSRLSYYVTQNLHESFVISVACFIKKTSLYHSFNCTLNLEGGCFI